MIVTEKLQFSFQGSTIINNLSFSLKGQEFTAVIGPNGAGKTTFLKLAAGILKPDSGKVLYPEYRSEKSGKTPKNLAKHLMWLPARIDMPFSYTVEDVLKMLLFPWERLSRFKNKDQAIKTGLTEVGIPEFAGRPFHSLSAGEQQRALLGAALVSDADILVLDEPCANLDVGAAHRTMKKLRSIAQQGKDVLFSIHDLQLAYQYCDNFLLLTPDRTAVPGNRDQIFSSLELKMAFGVNITKVQHAGDTILKFDESSQ